MAHAALGSPVALVLELDPDLGASIDPTEREIAARVCRGEVLRVRQGTWEPTVDWTDRDDLVAFVVIDGILAREVGIRDRCMLELLGHGDVLHAPVAPTLPHLGTATRLTAMSDVLLLALGRTFVRAAARWPSLLMKLQRRLEMQRESLAVQGLIAHLPNAEHRVLLMLRHLGDRWGHVTREGTVVPLPLSHEILGQLVGARRPTVTIAVRALVASGIIQRRPDGSWLLTKGAERAINAIARPHVVTRSLGERLLLYRLSVRNIDDGRALHAEAGQILTRRVAR